MKDRSLIGHSDAMEDLRTSIRETAVTDMTVLIQGETGTGKELVSRAIHSGSRRSQGPFIAMNCASFTESLAESELFGHVRGAFTGADTARKGKFELAHRGTLFLDEIGEISLAIQAKLLRVLEEREVDPIGSQRTIPVDFRLIAATHRDLARMVDKGKFRADLYYRLNVDTIPVPPLRQRLDDLEDLVRHFQRFYASERLQAPVGVSDEVLQLFRSYSWPGNLRELQNVVQRAVLKGKGEMIELKDLPERFFHNKLLTGVAPRNYEQTIRDASRQLCLWALETARGNRRRAATLLEMNRTSFRRVLKSHGLEYLLE